MQRNKLKELIVEHKDRFLLKKGLVRRAIQDKIRQFIPHKEVVLITGVRRSGKSSLMRLICDDLFKDFDVALSNILYLNFEDERFVDFSVRDFQTLYEVFIEKENPVGKKYFFLDEIHNIQGWERWINRLYEFEDIKIFITGSNASMLGSEVSTALTGRNRQITNWPFSFSEFLNLRGICIDEDAFYKTEFRANIKRLFNEYLVLGGFPEVLKHSDVTILEQYFKDIIYRDVIARHKIRNIKEIKEMTLFLASNIATIQSYGNLKELIRVKSLNTIKNYLEALSDVYLFFTIDLFDYSIKRQIYNPSKIYCIDTALIGSISFKFSQNLGHLYENIVFLQLKRNDKDIYYWRSKQGREVDFVVKKGTLVESVIQVCLSLKDMKVNKREIQALMDAKIELNPMNFIIITEDEEDLIEMDDINIEIIPLWKWLLKGGVNNY